MSSSPSDLSWDTIVFLLLMVFGLCVGLIPIILGFFRRANVLKHGVAAKGKIVYIMDTGRRHNTNPVVRIRLVVTDAAGEDFEAEVRMPVSPVRLALYQPGAVVPVQYDPRSRQRVAIMSEEADGKQR